VTGVWRRIGYTEHRLSVIAPLFLLSVALHAVAGYQLIIGTFDEERLPHALKADLPMTVGFVFLVSAPFVFGPLLRQRPPRPLIARDELGEVRSLLATLLYAPVLIFTAVLFIGVVQPGGAANLVAGGIMLWLLLNGRAIQAGA